MQNTLKYFLTQGDGIIIAGLVSLREQGAYALASNYGGLIARMLFQPIEETGRTTFAQLCSPTDKKEKLDPKGVESARNLLQDVLRFYGILGIVACAIGPSAAPVLLRFVAGSRWSDTDASTVLVSYCYYIPLLAINGVTEAFVAAVASMTTLHRQSALMFVWFAAFGGSIYFFVSVLGLGGSGLVYANCVNMALRIVFNTSFASRFFKRNGAVRCLADAKCY
jgi:oligosaccharide translocation protein RFT1